MVHDYGMEGNSYIPLFTCLDIEYLRQVSVSTHKCGHHLRHNTIHSCNLTKQSHLKAMNKCT